MQEPIGSLTNSPPKACPLLRVTSACPQSKPSLCKRAAAEGDTEGGDLPATAGSAHGLSLCERKTVNAKPGGLGESPFKIMPGRVKPTSSPIACPRLGVISACLLCGPPLCKWAAAGGGTEGGHLQATTGPAHRPPLCKREAVNARPGSNMLAILLVAMLIIIITRAWPRGPR